MNWLRQTEPKPRPLTDAELTQLMKSVEDQRGMMCVTEWDGDKAVKVLVVFPSSEKYSSAVQEYNALSNSWCVRCMHA